MTIPAPTPPPDDLARPERGASEPLTDNQLEVYAEMAIRASHEGLGSVGLAIRMLLTEVRRLRAENAKLKLDSQVFGRAVQSMASELRGYR